MVIENGLEVQEDLMKVHPLGVTRSTKEAVIALVPEDKKAEARALIRTGEEIAVIAARVSRSPRPVDEIAKEVDEEGAGNFHQKWTVANEGYGHKSVGEHAIVQEAIENASSEDIDQVTDNRLGSYTEFSARFRGRQNMGWFIPGSVKKSPELLQQWDQAHQRLFEACDEVTNKARAWIVTPEAQNAFPQLHQGYYATEDKPETAGAWKSRLGKHAADGFKDMLSASRLSSNRVTWNATEAEHALTKLLSSPSMSTRELGKRMKEVALDIVPTLVKYADFNPYLASLDLRRDQIIDFFDLRTEMAVDPESDLKTRIISDIEPENLMLAAFLYESSRTGSFGHLTGKIADLGSDARGVMFQMLLNDEVSWTDPEHGLVTSNGISAHVLPPRAFDFDGGYVYEMRNMNYGPWREAKRHRMLSYVAKPLDTKWGWFKPPLAEILDSSEDLQFHGTMDTITKVMSEMEELFKRVQTENPVDARYAVTRLHYRPAVMKFNMREAFHLLPLRSRDSALAFIRRLIWPTYDALASMHPNITDNMDLKGERRDIWFP